VRARPGSIGGSEGRPCPPSLPESSSAATATGFCRRRPAAHAPRRLVGQTFADNTVQQRCPPSAYRVLMAVGKAHRDCSTSARCAACDGVRSGSLKSPGWRPRFQMRQSPACGWRPAAALLIVPGRDSVPRKRPVSGVDATEGVPNEVEGS
jgi:hypothetical protein